MVGNGVCGSVVRWAVARTVRILCSMLQVYGIERTCGED